MKSRPFPIRIPDALRAIYEAAAARDGFDRPGMLASWMKWVLSKRDEETKRVTPGQWSPEGSRMTLAELLEASAVMIEKGSEYEGQCACCGMDDSCSTEDDRHSADCITRELRDRAG